MFTLLARSLHYRHPSKSDTSLKLPISIALATLAAAEMQALRLGKQVIRDISVDIKHAAVEFHSEHYVAIKGADAESVWGPIGGAHEVADGHVRLHDGFPHHREGILRLLGCKEDRTEVAAKLKKWRKVDFEDAAVAAGLCCVAIRTPEEWQAHPHASAVSHFPLRVTESGGPGTPGYSAHMATTSKAAIERKPLAGVRVLELSRVIAAPVGGKTLAAHGADVLWVTAPHLPALPRIDRDVGRGKRTTQLDLRREDDKVTLRELIKTSDVFLQSYRPDALAAKGFSADEIFEINPSIVYASLSAYGTDGPWSSRRGFDSLVQGATGLNIAEARAFGQPETPKPLPVQVLDHASGYLLALGIITALRRRVLHGGAQRVDVSLVGVRNWLWHLGTCSNPEVAFEVYQPQTAADVAEYVETKMSGLGELTAVKHSGKIDGLQADWPIQPKPLGADEPVWAPTP